MRISDWSSDVCSSDLFPPVPTGNRKIRPEAPPPSLQEGRFPSLRTARKGRKRRRFLSSCPVARLGRGNAPDPPARAYEPDAPASRVQGLRPTAHASSRERDARSGRTPENGRASCRERVGQYCEISGDGVA